MKFKIKTGKLLFFIVAILIEIKNMVIKAKNRYYMD